MVVHGPLSTRSIPHDTVAHKQFVGLATRGHGGNDGVIWPLAACDIVRVPILQRKTRATVLQRKTTAFGHGASPETSIVGRDERARIALRIGGGKVDRIGALEGLAVADIDGGLAGVKELGARLEVLLAEQFGDRDVHDGRVGDIVTRVRKRQTWGWRDVREETSVIFVHTHRSASMRTCRYSTELCSSLRMSSILP